MSTRKVNSRKQKAPKRTMSRATRIRKRIFGVTSLILAIVVASIPTTTAAAPAAFNFRQFDPTFTPNSQQTGLWKIDQGETVSDLNADCYVSMRMAGQTSLQKDGSFTTTGNGIGKQNMNDGGTGPTSYTSYSAEKALKAINVLATTQFSKYTDLQLIDIRYFSDEYTNQASTYVEQTENTYDVNARWKNSVLGLIAEGIDGLWAPKTDYWHPDLLSQYGINPHLFRYDNNQWYDVTTQSITVQDGKYPEAKLKVSSTDQAFALAYRNQMKVDIQTGAEIYSVPIASAKDRVGGGTANGNVNLSYTLHLENPNDVDRMKTLISAKSGLTITDDTRFYALNMYLIAPDGSFPKDKTANDDQIAISIPLKRTMSDSGHTTSNYRVFMLDASGDSVTEISGTGILYTTPDPEGYTAVQFLTSRVAQVAIVYTGTPSTPPPAPGKVNVTVTSNNTAYGTVAGGVTDADLNTNVTLTATPQPNCTFEGWYENNTTFLSNATPYTFSATKTMNITGRFKSNGTGGGTGGGGGTDPTPTPTYTLTMTDSRPQRATMGTPQATTNLTLDQNTVLSVSEATPEVSQKFANQLGANNINTPICKTFSIKKASGMDLTNGTNTVSGLSLYKPTPTANLEFKIDLYYLDGYGNLNPVNTPTYSSDASGAPEKVSFIMPLDGVSGMPIEDYAFVYTNDATHPAKLYVNDSRVNKPADTTAQTDVTALSGNRQLNITGSGTTDTQNAKAWLDAEGKETYSFEESFIELKDPTTGLQVTDVNSMVVTMPFSVGTKYKATDLAVYKVIKGTGTYTYTPVSANFETLESGVHQASFTLTPGDYNYDYLITYKPVRDYKVQMDDKRWDKLGTNAQGSPIEASVSNIDPASLNGDRKLIVKDDEPGDVIKNLLVAAGYQDYNVVPYDIFVKEVDEFGVEAAVPMDPADINEATINLPLPNVSHISDTTIRDTMVVCASADGNSLEKPQQVVSKEGNSVQFVAKHFSPYAIIYKNAYDVTVGTISPANGGTVTGDGVYQAGTTANMKASPAANYRFVNWTDVNGNQLSTSPQYSFPVNADTTVNANFEQITSTTGGTSGTTGGTTGGTQGGTTGGTGATGGTTGGTGATGGTSGGTGTTGGTTGGTGATGGTTGGSQGGTGTTGGGTGTTGGTTGGSGSTTGKTSNPYDMPVTGAFGPYKMIGVVLLTLFGSIEILSSLNTKKRRVVMNS